MKMTDYFFVAVVVVMTLVLAACGEPRKTPDGHLMDRPKMSAYGPEDVTTHDTDAASEDDASAEDAAD